MTVEVLDGKQTSFYPGGRAIQRPGTLVPEEGESYSDVLRSLLDESRSLNETWAQMSGSDWDLPVREPRGNPDLGTIPVSALALLRLTEVEVHGVDLDIGVSDWSRLFVEAALAMRVPMLATRRRNPGADESLPGAWLLVTTDGPTWRVSVDGDRVTSELSTASAVADAVIEGSSRDLLAMLLGRPGGQLAVTGDLEIGGGFKRAFPGP